MKLQIGIALGAACATVGTLVSATGQSSTNFSIPRDTINAGVADMISEKFWLAASVGDAASTGTVASMSYQLRNGFRAGVSGSPAVLNLLSVVSRRIHGAATFTLMIDHTKLISGTVTVEPRAIGGGHTLVFHFDQTITTVNTAATALDALMNSAGNATAATANGDVIVTLINVTDNTRLTITLNGLNGTGTAHASMGFLVGDITNSRSVNAADIGAIKANLNKPVSSDALAKFDLNADGTITQADVSAAKARSGLVLAP